MVQNRTQRDIADSTNISSTCTGRRAWRCELSTIDSTMLLAGGFAALKAVTTKAIPSVEGWL